MSLFASLARRAMTTSKTRASPSFFDGASHGALSGQIDRYNGIRVAEDRIAPSTTPTEFSEQLTNTVSVYREQGFTGVWLKLRLDQAHLAGVAVQDAGFEFHHTKPDYIMLSQWLPSTPTKLPGFASHYVGVGGLVLNKDRTKMLCIQERRPSMEFGALWKMPGGLVENGESIEEATVREVWEETGVKANFLSIVGFRELMKYQWGQQDLYYVCLLEPEGDETIDIQMPEEVSIAKWISISDMSDLKFTTMAQNVVNILDSLDAIKKGKVDINQMPRGELLDDASYTSEEFRSIRGNLNNFYTSQHLRRVHDFVKSKP